jgi:hypothetical protein
MIDETLAEVGASRGFTRKVLGPGRSKMPSKHGMSTRNKSKGKQVAYGPESDLEDEQDEAEVEDSSTEHDHQTPYESASEFDLSDGTDNNEDGGAPVLNSEQPEFKANSNSDSKSKDQSKHQEGNAESTCSISKSKSKGQEVVGEEYHDGGVEIKANSTSDPKWKGKGREVIEEEEQNGEANIKQKAHSHSASDYNGSSDSDIPSTPKPPKKKIRLDASLDVSSPHYTCPKPVF